MLDQIGTDLQEAVQELRNLAHGIYPPLLMDRGLPEALSAAAGRAVLPDRRARPRASAATRRRSRRRSTSAASRRCRTRASTPARARTIDRHAARGRGRAAVRGRRRRRRLRHGERRAARPRVREHGRPRRRDRRHGHGRLRAGTGHADHRVAIPLCAWSRARLRPGRARDQTSTQDVGSELLFVHVPGGAARRRVGGQVVGVVRRQQQHDGVGVRRGDPARRLDAVDARAC